MSSEFARWLQEEVVGRGWRQKDLALAAGVSQQTASRWMAGQTVPTIRSAQNLARALAVPTEEVVARLDVVAPPRASDQDEELAVLRKRVEQLEEQLRERRRA